VTPERQLAPLLLDWWREHGRRHLPWQQDPTPYRVWVSEIMLQQTQVSTVERYYLRFIQRFPDVLGLADADQDDVLHHWSGLGYYARARNLHRAAQVVRDEHGGVVPEDFDALHALPGIGRSTAGAILALSRNQRHPILDGNVKRVIARVFEVGGWPGRSTVARELWTLADRCTPDDDAAVYTQAIMDLGATVCTRGRPDCAQCPLTAICRAHMAGTQADYPGRAPKRKRPERHTAVILCLSHDGCVLLEKRPSEGVWGGLWGLPEADSVEDASRFGERQLGTRPTSVEIRDAINHAFTHFELQMTPVLLRLPVSDAAIMEDARWLWYNLRDPARVGLAAPVSRLLDSLGEEL
jgi:A/G-specific adenine glycosylase